MLLHRRINVAGYFVDIYDFDGRKFMYPLINRNAEFPANKAGYSAMKKWLRSITWMSKLVQHSI